MPCVESMSIGTDTMLPPASDGASTNIDTEVRLFAESTVANIAVGVSGTAWTGRPESARLAAVYWRLASVPVTSSTMARTTTTTVTPIIASVRCRRFVDRAVMRAAPGRAPSCAGDGHAPVEALAGNDVEHGLGDQVVERA